MPNEQGQPTKLEQNPLLKRLTRNVEEGDFLFRQGEPGNSIFLILSGRVQLVGERDGKSCVIDTIEAGEFVGEKAILEQQAFPRFCSAKAIHKTVAVEFSPNEIVTLEKENPALITMLVKKAFKVAAERLHKANQLAEILRGTDIRKRFLAFMHFKAVTTGKKELKGLRVDYDPTEIFYHLGLTEEQSGPWFEQFIKLKVILPDGRTHQYIVPDENAFRAFEVSDLKVAA